MSLHTVPGACIQFHVLTCSSMRLYEVQWACMRLHKIECSYMSLNAVTCTWAWMQLLELAWSSIKFHIFYWAAHKNFEVLVSIMNKKYWPHSLNRPIWGSFIQQLLNSQNWDRIRQRVLKSTGNFLSDEHKNSLFFVRKWLRKMSPKMPTPLEKRHAFGSY